MLVKVKQMHNTGIGFCLKVSQHVIGLFLMDQPLLSLGSAQSLMCAFPSEHPYSKQ